MIYLLNELKKKGVRIGLYSTVGDLLHAGHVIAIEESRAHCDYLIVAVLSDPTVDRPDSKNKPVQTLYERWVQVSSMKSVDMVIPFSTEKDLENMILTLKPDVRFVGEEYKGTEFTGHWIKTSDIVFLGRQHSFSSTELRHRVVAGGLSGKE
jgi:glycerol-3-phosphate cytidylyltransferase